MAAAGSSVTAFFHGNGLSVSADPISVLVATCSFASAEHIHVLNRRNYCRIPEIESVFLITGNYYQGPLENPGVPGQDGAEARQMTG